jgi:1,2-diacylglycerol 3-beta-glucosyltransferase
MLIGVALVVLSVPVLLWTMYLGFLALLSRANPLPPRPSSARMRFDIVVPAHNEQAGIGATVESLLRLDYPPELRRVFVVADNCSDTTAECASRAGALVLERHDPSRRGKGYALAYAFERLLGEGVADAIVVVDADTVVTANLLDAFAARLGRGAMAVQAHYGVANPMASWRTRLMHIALTLFHDVRSRARERLGASAGLRGNGMGFSTTLLREVRHDAFSIVEDIEYGIRIGLAGHRVQYAGEAMVLGEMASTEAASRSQRRRWEGGRWHLARRYSPHLLAEGVFHGKVVALDLAADLLVPPLTYIASALFAGLAASVTWAVLYHRAWWPLLPWGASLAAFAVYLLRGIVLARVGPRAIVDLSWAPVYMIWKMALAVRASRSREQEWVRTARQGEKP